MFESYKKVKGNYKSMLNTCKDEEIRRYLNKGLKNVRHDYIKKLVKNIIVLTVYFILSFAFFLFLYSNGIKEEISNSEGAVKIILIVLCILAVLTVCYLGYLIHSLLSIEGRVVFSEYEVDCIDNYFVDNIIVTGSYKVFERNGNFYYKDESGNIEKLESHNFIDDIDNLKDGSEVLEGLVYYVDKFGVASKFTIMYIDDNSQYIKGN